MHWTSSMSEHLGEFMIRSLLCTRACSLLYGMPAPSAERQQPVNNELLTGTVPVNNKLLTGTVPVNNTFH